MKNILGLFVLIASLAISGIAQVGPPVNAPPAPTPDPFPAATEAAKITGRSNDLRMTELFPVASDKERKIIRNQINPKYRKSTDEERELVAPTDGVKAQYADFLKKKNTGIVRLIADKGCVAKDDVVSGKAECAKYSMPGGGSAYSFRMKDYRLVRLADINFTKNRFEALGTLTHGILLYLGDVPIESVTLESEGMKHLQKIKPARNFADAGTYAGKIAKGYKDNGFVYASIMKAIPGRTYVLRTIAYRGEAVKTVGGLPYNELMFDKRRDMIVVFRVAAMNPGEDITLVWRELKDKKAPVLKK
ncbi:MAG: hypothetical protein HKN33_15335 [Pyrinomonadaceae bacterium]|nr:hypothetical protein [Pyrinomonadaceae bacterium]